MLLVVTCTTTNTTTAMEAGLCQSDFLATSPREISHDKEHQTSPEPYGCSTGHDFNESRCLFCNHLNTNLEGNLAQMLKSHGLHIDPTNLSVDVASFLAYFHVIISQYFECLYCGTQRNTRQGVQQHMMAKGHCKYDITDRNSELRDFYDLSSSDTDGKPKQDLQSSSNSQLSSRVRSRRQRLLTQANEERSRVSKPLSDQTSEDPGPVSHIEVEQTANATETAHSRSELSTRALKQGLALDNQLAQLRAEDRKSLLHLPASQQRALLATQQKQAGSARRTEQTQRSNLESAGNHFGCLGKMRLMRQPPHFGHVYSLNR